MGVLLMAALAMPCTAQRKDTLTLQHLFALAEEQSTSMQAFRTATESAAQEIGIAKTQRLPEVSTQLSMGYLGDGVLTDRQFDTWQHIDNPHFTNNFALKAQQIIYSGGAVSSSIHIAEKGKEMATLDYERNRQDVRFAIASGYLDLCRLQNRGQVIAKNIELAETLIANIRSRQAQGTALKTDVTRYLLHLQELQLQQTKIDDGRKVVCTQMAILLHLPSQDLFCAATDTGTDTNQMMMNEAQWQALASGGNKSIRQSELNTEICAEKVRMEKSALYPKISAFAEMHFDGPITIEVPVIDKNFGYWFAGIGVSYNLSSLYKNQRRIHKANNQWRLSKEQATEVREQVENRVQATYSTYLTAHKELQTQLKAVQLATENYEVVRNRYVNGLALLTDMLDASNAKLSAELAASDAAINILFHYYQLQYICHTL